MKCQVLSKSIFITLIQIIRKQTQRNDIHDIHDAMLIAVQISLRTLLIEM